MLLSFDQKCAIVRLFNDFISRIQNCKGPIDYILGFNHSMYDGSFQCKDVTVGVIIELCVGRLRLIWQLLSQHTALLTEDKAECIVDQVVLNWNQICVLRVLSD